MAAPARHKVARTLRAALGWPALALGLYVLAAWIGSSIPRNADWHQPPAAAADQVEILIETNGVHTAIVMPLVTPAKDWRADFPAADVAAPDRPYSHVSVSWGEREFYLNTPTWADLSPATVLRIAVTGGEGLLHVAHYIRPAPDATVRPLRIGAAEYARLVAAIEARMALAGSRKTYPGYGDHDVFYDAPGRYTPFNTCNTWTGDVLASAGIRVGRWTPFADGVMKWAPEPAVDKP